MPNKWDIINLCVRYNSFSIILRIKVYVQLVPYKPFPKQVIQSHAISLITLARKYTYM